MISSMFLENQVLDQVTTRDWVTGAIRLRSTLESLPVEELIPKSLKCCRMAKEETPSISKDLQELWRKLSLLIDSVQNNSKVVAFMKSPVGQYLDKHPFVALTLLVFVVVSAVPVGFFLLLVVLTSLAAFVGVILLEGILLSYLPPWNNDTIGRTVLGICNSGQRSLFLSKSHRPRHLSEQDWSSPWAASPCSVSSVAWASCHSPFQGPSSCATWWFPASSTTGFLPDH
uniref:Transmembrane protein 159 n=2 Tax=Molossus molossus TaxID=27622 RepID=A0A7J8J432_MOLMO|nr:transmembrane protein 159 [Molossus molossus]